MEISQYKRNRFRKWAQEQLVPTKTINPRLDTSDIRQAFMTECNTYIDNVTVDDIMIKLGYDNRPCSRDSYPYLNFNVSTRSPAFRK